MKTKIIPFDLETAKKIQAGDIEGKIKTRDEEHEMRIICYDSTAIFCGKRQPILAQDINDCECILAYFEDGAYMSSEDRHSKDLVIEVPDIKPQFKPFDKVLVRDDNGQKWCADFYSHFCDGKHQCVSYRWQQCIPYEGNEHLIGTTNKPKED